MIKEACVGSFAEAQKAAEAADRIELCDDLAEGGTTPSFGTVKYAVQLKVPIAVMIRARGGNFVYSSIEYEIMKSDLLAVLPMQPEAVVFGFLMESGAVDYSRSQEFIDLAHNAGVKAVFHKAIDLLPKESYFAAACQLERMGIDRILTSGGQETAEEGAAVLKKLRGLLSSAIVVGAGKVTADNVKVLSEQTGINEWHGKKICV